MPYLQFCLNSYHNIFMNEILYNPYKEGFIYITQVYLTYICLYFNMLYTWQACTDNTHWLEEPQNVLLR